MPPPTNNTLNCTPITPQSPFAGLSGDVVFIPGFGGSSLVNLTTNQIVWLTEQIASGQQTPDIALSISKTFGEGDDIGVAGLVVDNPANPFPTQFVTQLECLDQAGQIRLNLFPYDWRRDNVYTGALFLDFLVNIWSANGYKPILVIAHNIGTQITLQTMASLGSQNTKIFSGAVFAGGLFHGSVFGLAQQSTGLVVGNNTKILDYNTMFLMRSAWNFQCSDPNGCIVDANTNCPITADLYDPQVWLKNNFSKAFAPNNPSPPGAQDQMTYYLNDVLFLGSIVRDNQSPQSCKYPPMATICGGSVSTAAQVKGTQDQTTGKITVDYTKFVMAPGDGVVTYDSCQMVDGFQYTSFNSSNNHFYLLNDFNVVGQAFSAVGFGSGTALGWGSTSSTSSSGSDGNDDGNGGDGDGGWSSWW